MKLRRHAPKLLALALSWLLIGYIGYTFAQSGSTFYISAGIYPGAPSYTIWVDGSNYYAKDLNGQIDYSGTNASALIEDVFASASSGESVYFANGRYSLSTYLTLSKSLRLFGKGAILSSTSPLEILWITADNCTVSGLVFDGNDVCDVGIYIWNASYCTIEHTEIFDFTEYGIAVVGAADTADYNKILFNYIHDLSGGTYGTGVKVAYSGAPAHAGIGNEIIGNTVINVAEHGIKCYSPGNKTIISENLINKTGRTGISVDGCFSTVSNNKISYTGSGYGAIYVGNTAPSGNGQIIGNTIHNSSYYGIDIYQNNVTISGNVIYTASVGIVVRGNYTTINGGSIDHVTTGIYITGGRYNLVCGVQVHSSSYRGLYEAGVANYNVITTSIFEDYVNIIGANSHANHIFNGTAGWVA